VAAKVVSLVSGGIDSPVAIYLIAKRGLEPVVLHMDNRPFSDENTPRKVLINVKRISKLINMDIEVYLAPHGENLAALAKSCARPYLCVLCRRMMYRVANGFAKHVGAKAIVTGESLGQVASQTLANLAAESQASSLPILRPLLCYDKTEIESIAKKIGTYQTSIEPGFCCSITPRRPVISATLERVLEQEKPLPLDKLVKQSLKNIRPIEKTMLTKKD